MSDPIPNQGSRTNSPLPHRPKQEDAFDRFVRSKALILAIQFLVTGFLGLPLIWFSSSFTRSEKWTWSIIVTVYTLILIGIAAFSVYFMLRTFKETGIL